MQAARVLGLPSAGLAHLLDHYCGVTADKRYQLADWRVRPLAPELLAYARTDTHYLLYIHDRLKQQLLDLGAVDKVRIWKCMWNVHGYVHGAYPCAFVTKDEKLQLQLGAADKVRVCVVCKSWPVRGILMRKRTGCWT
jgi:hypothetical protein